MITTSLQALIFISYCIYICIKFKRILPSISDSWYELRELNQSRLFDAFAFSIGILMWFHVDDGPFNETCQMLFILAGISMITIAIASEFKKEMVKYFHFAGAILTIAICSYIVVVTVPFMLYGFIAAIVSTVCILLLPVKSKIFWIECVWFIFIINGLYLAYGASAQPTIST